MFQSEAAQKEVKKLKKKHLTITEDLIKMRKDYETKLRSRFEVEAREEAELEMMIEQDDLIEKDAIQYAKGDKKLAEEYYADKHFQLFGKRVNERNKFNYYIKELKPKLTRQQAEAKLLKRRQELYDHKINATKPLFTVDDKDLSGPPHTSILPKGWKAKIIDALLDE
jgi:hypothetical protein